MTLRDDVQTGLSTLSVGTPAPLGLDEEDACEIPVRIPTSIVPLAGGRLMVRIKLASSKQFFTYLAPLAVTANPLPSEVLERLIGDHLFADRTGGASYALSNESGVIFASHHWMVGSISPAQFKEQFHRFCSAAFLLLERVASIAGNVRGVVTIKDAEVR